MRIIRKFLLNQSGTVTLLVAAAMVAFVGFAALVSDVGYLYLNKTKITNALDSAVLAGAQELPNNPENAVTVASNYASMNGLSGEETSFTVSEDKMSITGIANRQTGLFLSNILGFDKADIIFRAKAETAPISAVKGVAPFGVLNGTYTFNDEVILKQGPGDITYPGWFGALDLGGTGSKVYEVNIMYGFSEKVKIGDVITAEEGNMSGPTKKGIEYRVGQCTHVPQCTVYSYQEGCPRIIFIPVINIKSLTPCTVEVVGFAAFFVIDYVGNGNDNMVKGAFIRYVTPGEMDPNADDYGLYGVKLCE